jgi:hypothetical protein
MDGNGLADIQIRPFGNAEKVKSRAPNRAICRIACGPSILAILERGHARGISKCVARVH